MACGSGFSHSICGTQLPAVLLDNKSSPKGSGEMQRRVESNNVERQLQKARQRLLDLSMRNRALNFRACKTRTIKVTDETPTEVYNTLVLKEKAMEFRPAFAREASEVRASDQSSPGPNDADNLNAAISEEESLLWKTPLPEAEPADGNCLQTSLERAALQKRLFHLFHQARTAIDEQGCTLLYLAIGFLEWTETQHTAHARRAPLILVPVELGRAKVGAAFKLRWSREDICANVSLEAKLLEQGVRLPEFAMSDDKTGIKWYFESVAVAVSGIQGWRVFPDIYLDFFSFTRFAIYKDLDSSAWAQDSTPDAHPLIQSVFNPSANAETPDGFSEDEIDEKLSVYEMYHVIDADPSQLAVIEDAKAGLNLVVEGPPGTGKSQTIVNLIAELMARGKSVLFVSNKMAALKVVKERLDKVGLGCFCLELYSRKANKREVLKELERCVCRQASGSVPLRKDYDELEIIKSELNEYATALREPFGKIKKSPFALYCLSEGARKHFVAAGRDMARIRFLSSINCDQKQIAVMMSAFDGLAQTLALVEPLAAHPWLGCEPMNVLPSDEYEIGSLINDCSAALSRLQISSDRLADICGVSRIDNVNDTVSAIDAANVVASSIAADRSVLLNEQWNSPNPQAEALIRKVEMLRDRLKMAMLRFQPQALNRDVASLLSEFEILSAKKSRFLSRRYRHLKREIAPLYKGEPARAIERITSDLEHLAECAKLREEIRQSQKTGKALFGSHWRAHESDPDTLRAFAEWIVAFRHQLLGSALAERSVDIICKGISRDQVEQAARMLADSAEQFRRKRDQLSERINIDYEAIFGASADQVSFSHFEARLKVWRAGMNRLQRWSQFCAVRRQCLATPAAPVIEMVNRGQIEPDDIIACLEGNLADDLLRLAFAENPALSNFVGELHENKIRHFAELDCKVIELNRRRLLHKLYQNRPRLTEGVSAHSEAGLLLGEFSRKRRQMPIRKLMMQAGGLIQKIKPCFMMSPLSIAQFLDPITIRFDVVVFDEASQVKPEDALGALLRARQCIMVGDTGQLPPTSFFDRLVAFEDENDENDEQDSSAGIEDRESILHRCKLSFRSKMLRRHYRSRHESLIALSNQEFYAEELVIYPSPIHQSDKLGLRLVHLPNTIYDRGRSGVNPQEAKAVAEAAVTHYRQFPHLSLGVGTFNSKQQRAILEEVELQLRLHPEMEEHFRSDRDDSFFVKNLETIQGDERDVIFLSIGFGFDERSRLSPNFGPLNQKGGERRLNVFITRARQGCIVFANFKASDLDLDANAPRGLKALKLFLNYAETGQLQSLKPAAEKAEQAFEASVYEFITNSGYEVRRQVGCGGFRVDLAIIDSQYPDHYLLGIECDGAKYYSSMVARERDRLRQQMLENLGWKLFHIWSTDWYRNRNESKQRLLKALRREQECKYNIDDSEAPDALAIPSGFYGKSVVESQYSKSSYPTMPGDDLEDSIAYYEQCSFLSIPMHGDLHQQPTEQLAEAVAQVVAVEGPVHFEETIRRIRALWGLKRAGQRIQDAINSAVYLAEKNGLVRRRGDFLWPPIEQPTRVRRRLEAHTPRIDLICNEEIAEAIRLVLRSQFATLPNDLIVQASRLLGIQTTSGPTASRIRGIVLTLIQNGELQRNSLGRIQFAFDIKNRK